MTKKELLEAIKDLPDDMEVIITNGASYYKLEGVDTNGVIINDDLDVYDSNWTAEQVDLEEDEWEEIKKKPRVLVLSD